MSNTRTHKPAAGDDTHEAHGADNPAPESNMSSDVINIGFHQFRVGVKRYPEEQQKLMRWLWGYVADSLGNSKIELMRQLNCDYQVIYDAWTGRAENIDMLCKLTAELKETAAKELPITETIVTKRIEEALNFALENPGSMVIIQGSTGRGKSYTAERWCKMHNHGRSRYYRVPSACSRHQLAVGLSKLQRAGVNGVKKAILEMRLHESVDDQNVLVIDEAGHLIPQSSGSTTAIELLRDLVDIRKCSVVLILTDVYLDAIDAGPWADYFEQFVGRIKMKVIIPKKILRAEVDAIVRQYAKQPGEALLNMAYEIANKREGKLRALFDDLNRAAIFAKNENREDITERDLSIAIKWRNKGNDWPKE